LLRHQKRKRRRECAERAEKEKKRGALGEKELRGFGSPFEKGWVRRHKEHKRKEGASDYFRGGKKRRQVRGRTEKNARLLSRNDPLKGLALREGKKGRPRGKKTGNIGTRS